MDASGSSSVALVAPVSSVRHPKLNYKLLLQRGLITPDILLKELANNHCRCEAPAYKELCSYIPFEKQYVLDDKTGQQMHILAKRPRLVPLALILGATLNLSVIEGGTETLLQKKNILQLLRGYIGSGDYVRDQIIAGTAPYTPDIPLKTRLEDAISAFSYIDKIKQMSEARVPLIKYEYYDHITTLNELNTLLRRLDELSHKITGHLAYYEQVAKPLAAPVVRRVLRGETAVNDKTMYMLSVHFPDIVKQWQETPILIRALKKLPLKEQAYLLALPYESPSVELINRSLEQLEKDGEDIYLQAIKRRHEHIIQADALSVALEIHVCNDEDLSAVSFAETHPLDVVCYYVEDSCYRYSIRDVVAWESLRAVEDPYTRQPLPMKIVNQLRTRQRCAANSRVSYTKSIPESWEELKAKPIVFETISIPVDISNSNFSYGHQVNARASDSTPKINVVDYISSEDWNEGYRYQAVDHESNEETF